VDAATETDDGSKVLSDLPPDAADF